MVKRKHKIDIPSILDHINASELFEKYWRKGALGDVYRIPILTTMSEVEEYYEREVELRDDLDCINGAFIGSDYDIILFPCLNECGSQDSLAGYIYANLLDDELYIDLLCSIKKTMGTFLMTLIILIAKELDIERIKLEPFPEVISFYKKFGFVTEGNEMVLNLGIYTPELYDRLKMNKSVFSN